MRNRWWHRYTTTGYDGEGQITSALDYVLNDDMPKVYMTTGHNAYLCKVCPSVVS